MKKIVFIIFIIFIVSFISTFNLPTELRIRVIANSDSLVDQKIKMEVVKRVNNRIKTMNQEDIINEVKNNIDLIDVVLEDYLGSTNYQLSISNSKYPTKVLEGKIIPGGTYPTLLIVIKEGLGKNWWSLLYPSYHNINFDELESSEVEFKFYFFNK